MAMSIRVAHPLALALVHTITMSSGVQMNIDRRQAFASAATEVCTDVSDWDNGLGFNCKSYEKMYCEDGGARAGMEWSLGQKFNAPESSCCACGKEGPMPNMAAAVTDTNGGKEFTKSNPDMFMRYMPAHNMVVCGCGKCGTTSLFQYIYEKEFSARFEWEGCAVQEVTQCPQWQGKWALYTDTAVQEKAMQNAYTFAIIRDPKERLVSAWKSKLACDVLGFHVDVRNRQQLVNELGDLAGVDFRADDTDCMSLDDFAHTLVTIHGLGRAAFLDRHFLPQDLGCFERFKPDEWSDVVSLNDDGAFDGLARNMGTDNVTVPHEHQSLKQVFVSSTAYTDLESVTRDEYAVLKPYLKTASLVTPEHWTLLTGL